MLIPQLSINRPIWYEITGKTPISTCSAYESHCFLFTNRFIISIYPIYVEISRYRQVYNGQTDILKQKTEFSWTSRHDRSLKIAFSERGQFFTPDGFFKIRNIVTRKKFPIIGLNFARTLPIMDPFLNGCFIIVVRGNHNIKHRACKLKNQTYCDFVEFCSMVRKLTNKTQKMSDCWWVKSVLFVSFRVFEHDLRNS